MRSTALRFGAPRWSGAADGWTNALFSLGDVFGATAISTGLPSWSWIQIPFELDARRPIDALDAEGLESLGEAVEIVLEYAERDVLVLLARSLADRAPDMRTALRRERESGAAFADLEPEFVVKGFGRGQIRDDEMEMVERMHAELAGPARRLHETLNCRHAVSSQACNCVA